MAVTKSALAIVSGLQVYKQVGASATAANNVTGAPSTVYGCVVDNTGNPSQDVYFKLYDATAPTVGTTVPADILLVPGGFSRTFMFPGGSDFATGLSWAVTTVGGTAGTISPTASVTVTVNATP